jgi:3-oxoacyl-[acyl-carrier-protein] synthase-3
MYMQVMSQTRRVDHGATGVAARLAGIATHLPDHVLTNEELARQFSGWTPEKILEKTGIRERRIAGPNETALDLGYGAARKLLDSRIEGADPVDFLILCTQAPDYILPTSACILQDRLGLPTSVGALDINLGCSGYVYGLSLAGGLIASGAARNVMLVTADTYSKYMHAGDKSVRTLFGDGAAATLVSACGFGDCSRIGPFVFGTDGSGAQHLIVESGGFRLPGSADTSEEQTDRHGNVRSRQNLYMNGGEVLTFTLREVPRAYRAMLESSGTAPEDFDHVILHQANKFMVDALQKKLGLPDEKVPRRYEEIGNTVSSTIPFVLAGLQEQGQLSEGARIMLIGFGVGLSWAAATITI